MARSRADRILEQWSAVADTARPPMAPRRRSVVRGSLQGPTFATVALLVVAVAGGVWFANQRSSGIGDPVVSPPAASGSAEPSASSALASCLPTALAARITLWEGAAGHRIAHVALTNQGSEACTISTLERPELVDGHGAVLIDGKAAHASAPLTLAPGATARTLVQAGNYCGRDPAPPVSVAFVLAGSDRVVASPLSPDDVTVPPCLGTGQPADIQMQPWMS
ncbi:MAG TPA: DUF4232 domain-containing protein [Candidatus Limnocylindrales bacterium]|nr:DUF4232 domain-containing protein [Candidatus Limnocylindrales bacterium]